MVNTQSESRMAKPNELYSFSLSSWTEMFGYQASVTQPSTGIVYL